MKTPVLDLPPSWKRERELELELYAEEQKPRTKGPRTVEQAAREVLGRWVISRRRARGE